MRVIFGFIWMIYMIGAIVANAISALFRTMFFGMAQEFKAGRIKNFLLLPFYAIYFLFRIIGGLIFRR